MDHRLDWESEREEKEERETLEAINKHRELVEEWLKKNEIDNYILGNGAVYLMHSYHSCIRDNGEFLLFENKVGELRDENIINPVENISIEKCSSSFKIGLGESNRRIITVDGEANITRIE